MNEKREKMMKEQKKREEKLLNYKLNFEINI